MLSCAALRCFGGALPHNKLLLLLLRLLLAAAPAAAAAAAAAVAAAAAAFFRIMFGDFVFRCSFSYGFLVRFLVRFF